MFTGFWPVDQDGLPAHLRSPLLTVKHILYYHITREIESIWHLCNFVHITLGLQVSDTGPYTITIVFTLSLPGYD